MSETLEFKSSVSQLFFKLSDNLIIDYSQFREEGLRVTVLARAGAGKSNLGALFVEQALDAGVQVCIIEPLAEWYTLRSMYDSVVWIGEGGDLPIVPDVVHMYSRMLEDGASIILTTGDLEDAILEKAFVGRFLQSLYYRWKKVRRPILLLIEDAEAYAPQMWSREDRPSLSWLIAMAKRGRKLGINTIFISQRPAELHKGTWSQSNILFIGGFKTSRDLQAVAEMARLMHMNFSTNDVYKLGVGQFYCFMFGELYKIKALRRKTPHGGETPNIVPVRQDLAISIDVLRKEIEDVLRKKKEEEDEVKRLKDEVQRLMHENEELRRQVETLKIVKEVPLELKVLGSSGVLSSSIQSYQNVPEAVLTCPYKGALKVYQYLMHKGDYAKVREISAETGVGFETVKKIVRYLRRKGLVRTKMDSRGYVKGVRLK